MRLKRAVLLSALALQAIVVSLAVQAHDEHNGTLWSLVQLIANPDKYDGHEVRVVGYVRLEFEGNAIYLHREDYEKGLTANALWLDTRSCNSRASGKPFTKGYAVVEGTFSSTNHGHMGMFSGAIVRITRCDHYNE